MCYLCQCELSLGLIIMFCVANPSETPNHSFYGVHVSFIFFCLHFIPMHSICCVFAFYCSSFIVSTCQSFCVIMPICIVCISSQSIQYVVSLHFIVHPLLCQHVNPFVLSCQLVLYAFHPKAFNMLCLCILLFILCCVNMSILFVLSCQFVLYAFHPKAFNILCLCIFIVHPLLYQHVNPFFVLSCQFVFYAFHPNVFNMLCQYVNPFLCYRVIWYCLHFISLI